MKMNLKPTAHQVGPVPLMDVKNVDPESVTLLEGSLAERTWKLPIPLVHTGSVLEVLISVVFVGEHLATAFTSVTFGRLCQR